jgi:uncharacterized membrane protein YeaQ/YmgE (transglycosylase-associated protein family)
MSWILFILFGFVIGLLARAIVPGKQKLGILWTTLLGVGGALLGGLVSNLITGRALTELHAAGFIGSLAGAIVLLLGYVAIMRRRHPGGGGPQAPGTPAH